MSIDTSPGELQILTNVIGVLRKEISELKRLITDPKMLSDISAVIKDEAWITKKHAAEIADVTIRTIENRMKDGVYRFAKTGRQVRIRREDLARFMELNEIDNYRKRRTR